MSATRSSAARSTPRVSRTASRRAACTAPRKEKELIYTAAQGSRSQATCRHRPRLRVKARLPAGLQGHDGRQEAGCPAPAIPALEGCREKTGTDPVVHAQACARQREAGHRGQVPPRRRRPTRSRSRSRARVAPRSRCAGFVATGGHREKTMHERLMNEILDASTTSMPLYKREDTHKMADPTRPSLTSGAGGAGRRPPHHRHQTHFTFTLRTATQRGRRHHHRPAQGPQHRHHGAHRRQQDHHH